MLDIWNELPKKKILALGALLFCTMINQVILANLGATLLVSSAGPEAPSFVTITIVIPALTAVLILFKKLRQWQRKELNFWLFITLFILVVMTFAFYIYPNQAHIHPSPETVSRWTAAYPSLWVFWNILGSWTNALYFIVATLWPGFAFGIIFWQIADDIVIKKNIVFPVFGFFSAIANLIAGVMMQQIISSSDSWGQSMITASVIFMAVCFVIIAIYGKINLSYKRHSVFVQELPDVLQNESKNAEGSLLKDIMVMFKDRALFSMFLTFAALGFILNGADLLWKSEIKELYPEPNDFGLFMSYYEILYGFIAGGLSFVAVFALSKAKWSFKSRTVIYGALFVYSLFFVFYAAKYDLFGFDMAFLQVSQLTLIWIATVVNTTANAAEYQILRPNLKLCYSKMSPQTAMIGRTVNEVIGIRTGMVLGALSVQLTLAYFKSVPASAMAIMGIIATFVLVRFIGVCILAPTLKLDD